MVAIAAIETIHVALPTRRDHKWTGLTEPIGGYLLVRMEGDDGTVGWGEAPALKDWGGELRDLKSSRVRVSGVRRTTAFAFKGPGTRGRLTSATRRR